MFSWRRYLSSISKFQASQEQSLQSCRSVGDVFLKISASGEWSVSTRKCITGAESVLVGRVVDRYRLFTKYFNYYRDRKTKERKPSVTKKKTFDIKNQLKKITDEISQAQLQASTKNGEHTGQKMTRKCHQAKNILYNLCLISLTALLL